MINISQYTVSAKLRNSFIFSLLFVVFVVAYILSPYWKLVDSLAGQIIFLLSLGSLGFFWAFLSSGSFEFLWRFDNQEIVRYVGLAVILFVLNYKALGTGLPWRGDEDYHVDRTIRLGTAMGVKVLLLVIPLVALYLVEGLRNSKWSILSSAFFAIMIGIIAFSTEISEGALTRYPFVSYWVALIPPSISVIVTGNYNEATFRFIPFFSTLFILWFVFRNMSGYGRTVAVLFALAVATLPILFYYTSIFYLEMPAVFFLTIVCFGIGSMAGKHSKEIKQQGAWYALILTGFVKETAVAIMVVFVLWYLANRFFYSHSKLGRRWELLDSGRVIFGILLPIGLYLAFRSLFGTSRSFAPHLNNLLDLEVYAILMRSYLEQFGAFIILMLLGWLVMLITAQYWSLLFLTSAFVADVLFHLLDSDIYVGHSRFNIFLVPIILASVAVLIRRVALRSRVLAAVSLIVTIVISLLLSPINRDGTKEPNWGDYRVNTSEHYYPYREAITWVLQHHPTECVIYVVGNYRYNFNYYYSRVPEDSCYEMILRKDRNEGDNAAIERILSKLAVKSGQPVVFQVLDSNIDLEATSAGYKMERVFANEAHRLILFSNSELPP